jgi:hypothetical protein
LPTARPVNTGSYRFVRLGDADSNGLKIRCPKGRAGSTPALGTITDLPVEFRTFDLLNGRIGSRHGPV